MKILSQRDAMDCGPSCLAMIAGHYGLQLDRDDLLEATKSLMRTTSESLQ